MEEFLSARGDSVLVGTAISILGRCSHFHTTSDVCSTLTQWCLKPLLLPDEGVFPFRKAQVQNCAEPLGWIYTETLPCGI